MTPIFHLIDSREGIDIRTHIADLWSIIFSPRYKTSFDIFISFFLHRFSVQVITLTRSTIDTESVTVGTLARVASRRILADADAEMIVLEFRALVNVAARSVVGIQPEPSFASASVATPHIQAHVLTESRCLLTLVDILEEIAITFLDENILGYCLPKL